MIGEIDVAGVYVSPLLVCLIAGFGLQLLCSGLLRRLGWYRHLWHPALFDVALFFILSGGVFALLGFATTPTI